MEKTWIGSLSLDHAAPESRKYHYPLLFIHGMHEGSWFFQNWLQVAADMGWDAWAINLRGHHDSKPVQRFGKVSIMDYVEDVEDVLREIGPAVLVSRSMGGLIAQLVADRNQDIPAVVLLNSAPPRGIFPGNRDTLSKYWKPPYLIATALKRPLQPQKGDMMNLVFNNMSPEEAEAAFQRFVPESGLATRELTFWWRCGPETKIDCPVLVVGATQDRLTPVGIQKRIARKYAGATYQQFPGAHALPLEKGSQAPIKFILKWAAEHVS